MRFVISFLLVLTCLFSKGQGLLIYLDSLTLNKSYSCQFVKTKSDELNQTCFILNIGQSYTDPKFGQTHYVFKVFTNSVVKIKKRKSINDQIDSLIRIFGPKQLPRKNGTKLRPYNPSENRISFSYVKKKIDGILKSDFLLSVDELSSMPLGYGQEDYQLLYDYLSIVRGDSLFFFNGSLLLQYFILKNFNQVTPLQSNYTLINTKAILTKMRFITKGENDSIPLYPLIDNKGLYRTNNKIYLIDNKGLYRTNNKIYLIDSTYHHSGTEYLFCRLTTENEHDRFHYPEFFKYRYDVGIKEFKGIYIYSKSSLIERFSDKTYEFKFVEYLKL